MSSTSISDFDYALKRLYSSKKVTWVAFKDNPFLALLKKNPNFSGSAFAVPVRYQSTQGRGVDFTSAQTNIGPAKGVQFLLTMKPSYSLARIDGQVIAQSRNDMGAMLKQAEAEIDAAIYTAGRDIARAIVSNGGNARGQISATSNVAIATITLADTSQIVNFEPGMVLNVSANDGTSGSKRSGTVTVSAVDYDLGTITTTAHWDDAISGVTAGDYIFQNGDIESTNSGVAGLGAWNPSTAPSSGDSFYGVDRSVSPTRLAGVRVTTTASTMEEKLIDCITKSARFGAKTSHIFLNPLDLGDLVKNLGAKVQYVDAVGKDATVGFTAVKIMGPMGAVQVVGDLNFPQGRARGVNMDVLELVSALEAPHIDQDGGKMVKVYNADAIEVRVRSYVNLVCYDPSQLWTAAV